MIEVEEDREFGNGPSSDEASFGADFEDLPPIPLKEKVDPDKLIGFEEFLGVNANLSDGERSNERLTDRENERKIQSSSGFRQYVRPIPNSIMPTADFPSQEQKGIVSEDRSLDNKSEQLYEDDLDSVKSKTKSVKSLRSKKSNKSLRSKKSRPKSITSEQSENPDKRDKHNSIVGILKQMRNQERDAQNTSQKSLLNNSEVDFGLNGPAKQRELQPGHKTMFDRAVKAPFEKKNTKGPGTHDNFYAEHAHKEAWNALNSNRSKESKVEAVSKDLPKSQKWAPFERPRKIQGNIYQSNLPEKVEPAKEKSELEISENSEDREFNDFLRGNKDGFF